MTWSWDAYDPDGQQRIADSLHDPWPTTPVEAAELAMARLMLRVAPDFGTVRGWRVRAFADGQGEAWCDADDWLRVHEPVSR